MTYREQDWETRAKAEATRANEAWAALARLKAAGRRRRWDAALTFLRRGVFGSVGIAAVLGLIMWGKHCAASEERLCDRACGDAGVVDSQGGCGPVPLECLCETAKGTRVIRPWGDK